MARATDDSIVILPLEPPEWPAFLAEESLRTLSRLITERFRLPAHLAGGWIQGEPPRGVEEGPPCLPGEPEGGREGDGAATET
jgi:hypothetical protein